MNARQMVKYRKKRFFFNSSLWEENRWGTIVISFDYIYIYCILMENFETRFYLLYKKYKGVIYKRKSFDESATFRKFIS